MTHTFNLAPRQQLLQISPYLIMLCLALVLSLLPSISQAADADRQYRVRAINKVETCYALNRAVHSAKKEDDWAALYGFSLYTMGYLTAINRLAATPAVFDFLLRHLTKPRGGR